jgi:hypothetical protein
MRTNILRRTINVSLATLVLGLGLYANARPALPVPRERIVLTITGRIRVHNQGSRAVFDIDMLEALPQHTFTTHTPWTEHRVSFSGPLLRDLLALVGANGRKLRASALDDYRTIIPIEDAHLYDVIIATRKNGTPMTVRDKGPLFIVYPFDQNPALKSLRFYERSIWQVHLLEVE